MREEVVDYFNKLLNTDKFSVIKKTYDDFFNSSDLEEFGYQIFAADYLSEGINFTLDGNIAIELKFAPAKVKKINELLVCLQKKESFESDLSVNEKQVLSLAADDKIDREIADILNISRETVRYYFKSIYLKLQVHSKHGAIAKAIREGLL